MYAKVDGKWERTAVGRQRRARKRHGLQGPIDDAFMDSFVMVKPTGQADEREDRRVGREGDEARGRSLAEAVPRRRPGEERHRDHRGGHHEQQPRPLGRPDEQRGARRRSPTSCRSSGPTTASRSATRPTTAGTHVPVLIYPNPLNPKKYVVLNSGFTFREYDYLNNARQVPKLPDYAVIDITTPPNSRYPGQGRPRRVLRREVGAAAGRREVTSALVDRRWRQRWLSIAMRRRQVPCRLPPCDQSTTSLVTRLTARSRTGSRTACPAPSPRGSTVTPSGKRHVVHEHREVQRRARSSSSSSPPAPCS